METNRTGKKQPGDRRKPDRDPARQRRRARAGETPSGQELSNAELAELLARRAERARPPLTRAFRRASRRALLWPGRSIVIAEARSFIDRVAKASAPYLEKVVRTWFNDAPLAPSPTALRSGFLTFTEAQATLAAQPEWMPGLKGDLQMHSKWSDGSVSIAEMAAAGVELGYEYIAITDHAKGLKIAGGHRRSAVARASRRNCLRQSVIWRVLGHKLRVLRSIELNLNPEGQGDMEPQALAELDIVIGCFHSALRRKEDQTERYLAALRNPTIQILGHPRGRIYNYRTGLSADWARVFTLAAELDKAVEIDAYPDRQDLSPDLLTFAREAGCRISFGTDAHGPSQLRFMAFAAASALRAGIARERILNFMSRDELLDWVRDVRRASSRTKGRD